MTKKKISHTEQLRSLRADRNRWYEIADIRLREIFNLKSELNYINKIYPKKHYRLKFNGNTEDGLTHEWTEIIKGYGIDNAIDDYKKTLLYPDTFELIDIELIE